MTKTESNGRSLSSRVNRRAFTKGAPGRALRRAAYYARFRGGNNRVQRAAES